MTEDESPSDKPEIEPPPFFDKREEAEASFWRLKKASDKWREDRVKRVLAQEGEGLFTTLGRMIFVSSCIFFDFIVMIQIPVSLGKTTLSWAIYVTLLVMAIKYQREFYDNWFKIDISQIHFENP